MDRIICSDCGKEKRPTSKSCNVCSSCAQKRHIKRYGHTGRIVAAGKRNALRRGTPWLLTKAQVLALREGGCIYCGNLLPTHQPGLDRIDNFYGYVVGNVVPACHSCNDNRGKLTFEEWWLILEDRRQKWESANGPTL